MAALFTELAHWAEDLKALGALLALLLPFAVVIYALARGFYNVFLHPLRSYPGPILWRATRLPYDWFSFQGTLHDRVVDLHKQYGDAIRLTPTDLSFISSQARKDILAHFPGREEFPKDLSRATPSPNGYQSILLSHKDNHSRFRRLLAYAFSDKGLREQEVHIRRHVDLLIDNLTRRAKAGEVINAVEWFNMVTFDIIGYLAFGRSFGCLENGGEMHSWIPNISASVKYSLQNAILQQWGLQFLSGFLLDEKTKQGRIRNFMYAQESIKLRLEEGNDKGDFWDRVLVKSEKNESTGEGMHRSEMLNNSAVLVLGGAETSATAMSGALHLLFQHPDKMQRLVEEIRSTFNSTEDITIHSIHQLKYLPAVMDETMRIYPPVPQQQPRISPPGGGTVLGKYIPEGTSLSPHQLAANRSPLNFHRPDDFVPERWMSNGKAGPEFDNDDRAACQPFSLGTRNCIGKNLAAAEMYLIMSKLLYHFDLSAGNRINDGRDWFDQHAWGVRWKKPVWVKLEVAEH